MDDGSLLLKRVEYQTLHADWHLGLVVEHDLSTDRVVVLDEDDGTRWRGYANHVTLADD